MSAPVDPRHARPVPHVLHPNDAALNAIAEARLAAELARTAVDDLLELFRRADTPADMVVVTLTAAEPVKLPRAHGKSVGILNPTSAPVFLGVGGASASAAGRSPSCPAKSAITLPIYANQIEIGANPADVAAGDLTVYAFFFESVQPLSLGGVP
jgi:hypothetical protein